MSEKKPTREQDFVRNEPRNHMDEDRLLAKLNKAMELLKEISESLGYLTQSLGYEFSNHETQMIDNIQDKICKFMEDG